LVLLVRNALHRGLDSHISGPIALHRGLIPLPFDTVALVVC
jgi:hypothetical protein